MTARTAAGLPLFDLTASNPTRCGFLIDTHAVLAPLAEPGALDYAPAPFGRTPARSAVAAYYADHDTPDAPLDVNHICLTTSTSEAYSFLFRLLANSGDEILIACPSYPLFDYLAAIDDVRLVPYPLLYEHGWQLEPGAIEARITPHTRAIALVHPNNPTGHFVSPAERAALEELCVRHGLALLVDEVFLDYRWNAQTGHASDRPRSFAHGPHPALTFVLSGISKVAALPQMKLSWLAIFGPTELRNEARARLEVIADTFLSVSGPAQQALPAWLSRRHAIQQQILARLAENLALLDRFLAGTPCSRLTAQGGWYTVLRIPAVVEDEAFALRLLEAEGVLVHPGSAFGFPQAGWLVLSLLPSPAVFEQGIAAIVRTVHSLIATVPTVGTGEQK